MVLRLIRPRLKYFNSFISNVHNPKIPALEYVTKALANEDEKEYWLMNGDQCVGRVFFGKQARGRKMALASHVDIEFRNDTEEKLIKLVAKKARSLGVDPILLTCEATNYARREGIERNGGELISLVRERTAQHRGKRVVYSFSSSAPASAPSEL